MDLAEWYAAGRTVGLLDLIDSLPSASRYYEAVSNDPEMAEHLARQPESDEEWSPRVVEYGLTEMLLREILHELKVNSAITMSAAGGKPGELKPFPTPRTAVQAARERLEREWAVNLAGKFGFGSDDI